MKADNSWKVYLATDDVAKTVEAAQGEGARVVAPPMAITDLGSQAVIVDPTGAALGIWEPGTFPGFTVLNEHGAPSWSELLTRDYATAVDFYRSVFRWDTTTVSDSDEFRYTVMRNPAGDGELAGIMDASTFLAAGEASSWSVYWEVDDTDAIVATAAALGGSVLTEPRDTPYGRLAAVADPAGASFKLRTPPR
jgi:hypothetical protein